MVERKLEGSKLGIIVDKSKATGYYNLRVTPFPRNSRLNGYDPYNSSSRGINVLYHKRGLTRKVGENKR